MGELDRAEALLKEGRLDEARGLLKELTNDGLEDSSWHVRMADLAGALGQVETMVKELGLAHRDAPEDLALLKRLAGAHQDAGNCESAIRCLQTVVERDVGDADSWDELGALLAQTARLEEAADCYERAFHLTGDQRFPALKSSLTQAFEPEDDERPDESYPSSLLVQRFLSLFSGREGVYARQWAKPQNESGYTPIREPFTPNVAENHLLGNHTVGVYPLRLDNTVHFAAIDFDLSRGLLRKVRYGGPEWRQAMDRLADYSFHFQAVAQLHGIPGYLEYSGFKGRHLWIFFAEPIKAKLARNLGAFLLEAAGPPPMEMGVEVFPKQYQLAADGLGNLIKLPLGIHRRTGERATLLDARGDPVGQEKEERFLQSIERLGRLELLKNLEEAANPPAEVPALFEAPEREQALVVTRVVEPEYHLEEDHELQLLLGRCVTLRALVEKVEREAELSHDEARVLIHTIGHLRTGPQAVNAIFRRCPGMSDSLFLVSRLRGNPVSCPKIRSRIPHITSRLPCDCEFTQEAGLYPTPELHLRQPGELELNRLQLRALLEDFLRVGKEIEGLRQLQAVYRQRLDSWFEQAGVEELATPMGRLVRRRAEDDAQPSFSLEV